MFELTRVNFAALNIPQSSFPARDQWLLDCWYVGGFDASGNYTGCDSNGKTINGSSNAKHINFAPLGGVPASKGSMVHQLTAKVQGINGLVHLRRLFVVTPYINIDSEPSYWLKPLLLVAAPGSGGDSARDLFSNPTSDIQFSWPLRVAIDNGIFAVLVDQEAFGWNAYLNIPPHVENSRDPIINHIACIDAARWFIDNCPLYKLADHISAGAGFANAKSLKLPIMPNLLVGGLSYGANTSSFLCGALKDVEAVYLAGDAVNKSQFAINTAARFRPPEWDASGYDYIDMWKASNVKKMMISFGQGDYQRENNVWTVASVDNTCNAIKAYDPARFDWRVSGSAPVQQGHEIDLPHIRQWFHDRVADMVSGYRCFSMQLY